MFDIYTLGRQHLDNSKNSHLHSVHVSIIDNLLFITFRMHNLRYSYICLCALNFKVTNAAIRIPVSNEYLSYMSSNLLLLQTLPI